VAEQPHYSPSQASPVPRWFRPCRRRRPPSRRLALSFLDQITTSGRLVNSLQVPDGSSRHGDRPGEQVVTSFSSKSELALNLSTDGRYVTFMGYVAPVNGVDVSNSNTPDVIDPTNPVPGANFRAVEQVDAQGDFHATETSEPFRVTIRDVG
jgi:hypothetical protein